MMPKIDVVITMGGLGSRFRKMGYDKPKYMIEAKGKSLFEWSMISLTGYKKDVSQYIFIAMKDDKYDVEEFIDQKCKEMKLQNYHIIILDYLTDGQATTAMIASKYWEIDNQLLIYNIDTYVDISGKVVEIKEKERISDYCTLGAYYFRTCKLYKELYDEYYSKTTELVNGEKYVAPLYDYLLTKNGEIYISVINSDKVHILGTPEELQSFLEES